MPIKYLSVVSTASRTPLNDLRPPLLIQSMQTLKAISHLYRGEFEDRYTDERLSTVPVYCIELATDAADTVYGYIALLVKKNVDVAVLLDYRILRN